MSKEGVFTKFGVHVALCGVAGTLKTPRKAGWEEARLSSHSVFRHFQDEDL